MTQEQTWITTGYFREDLQDTKYTCGPSSLSMALSALGCNITEATLSKLAKTTKDGTNPSNLQKAIIEAGKICGIPLTTTNPPLKQTSWKKIAELLSKGCEIIIHLQTYPALAYDYKGNPVWKKAYGHYTYLVGVNLKQQLAKIADPTKGIKTFTFTQIEKATSAITWANSLHIICKK